MSADAAASDSSRSGETVPSGQPMTAACVEARHLIRGRWIGAERTARRWNPARGDELVSVAPVGDRNIVDEAVAAARASAPVWASMSGEARGAVLARTAGALRARASEAATLIAREEGKTLAEASGEVGRAAAMLEFYASLGRQPLGSTLPSADGSMHLYTTREPVGVVGLVTPWNFPIAIPVWKAAPALVAGNTVVVKPASIVPGSMHLLAECFEEAGLPAGVLNVVHGSGGEAGQALVEHPEVDAISFTGSGAVGRRINITAAERMARVQLELGGKNGMLVMPDADMELAADLCARGAFGLTGQACTATSRVVVMEGDEQRFLDALVARTMQIRIGDPLDPDTTMGPVVTEQQLRTDVSWIERALADGAELVSGGVASGAFLTPTILRRVEPEHAIAREEVFGPVLAVMVARSPEEAMRIMNGTEYGLSAGIVTNDLAAAMEFSRTIDAGVIKVNRLTTGTDVNAPFGGMRASSNGLFREQGFSATDFFTRVKTTYVGF